MFAQFHIVRLWLEQHAGVAAPWVSLTILVFAAVNGIKKFVPGLWIWFDKITPNDGLVEHVVMGLPSVALGALSTWMLTGGELAEIWKGAMAAAVAPILHLWAKNYTGSPAKTTPPGAGTVALALFLGFVCSGCAGSFEEAKVAGRGVKIGAPPPTPECRSLDGARRTWSSFAAGSAVLSGASGLASIPDYDSKELRIGLAAGAVATATLAAFSVRQSDGFGESWARECTGP